MFRMQSVMPDGALAKLNRLSYKLRVVPIPRPSPDLFKDCNCMGAIERSEERMMHKFL